MKKQILINLIFLSSFLTIYSQWNGTNPVWTNSNVGIGVTNPGSKLTIRSDMSTWSFYTHINTLPSDGSDGGLYLGSIQTDNSIIGSGGTYYSSGKWLSKGTTLSAISFVNGNIS